MERGSDDLYYRCGTNATKTGRDHAWWVSGKRREFKNQLLKSDGVKFGPTVIPGALTIQKLLLSWVDKYLLLTELEVRTGSYGPRFFSLRFMAHARRARVINWRRRKRVASNNIMDRETRLGRYLLYLYCSTGSETISAANVWCTSKTKWANLKSLLSRCN